MRRHSVSTSDSGGHLIQSKCGRTGGRQITLTKEANKWEERYFLGEVDDSEIEYTVDECDGSLDAAIRELCNQFGERAAAQNLGISRTALRRVLKCGVGNLSRATRARMLRRMHFAG
jgi:hypothetical protein